VGTRRALLHLREVAGLRAARGGDYTAAVEQWEGALALDPTNARLIRNLALAEERLERWDQASSRWEVLIRQWRKELQTAREARRAGARREPRAGAPAAEELRRWLAVGYRHQAAALEAAEDFPAASRTLERALTFDPTDIDLRLRAAELYLDYDAYASAIEHLRRALAARPNDVKILLELGSALDLKGDDRQAQSWLEQALALEPHNPVARDILAGVHHGRGLRLAESGAPARALAEFQRAVDLAPGVGPHHIGLGAQYLTLGQLDAAKRAFDLAIELRPRDAAVRFLIARAYLGRGEHQRAEQLFGQMLRLERGPMAQAVVGLTYLRVGDPAKAEPYLRRVLRGNDARALAAVGRALIHAHREADAAPYLERVVALDPWDLEAHRSLAYAVAFGQRDHERAAAELEAAEGAAKLAGRQDILAEIAAAREIQGVMATLDARAAP
jgi:tetratricopeptide (TPR) repeat protein